jgi:hypothetical protein
VPWSEVQQDAQQIQSRQAELRRRSSRVPPGGWKLSDRNAELGGPYGYLSANLTLKLKTFCLVGQPDIFNEQDQVAMPTPVRETPVRETGPVYAGMPAASTSSVRMPSADSGGDVIELTSRNVK